jgi:hypothetical protein
MTPLLRHYRPTGGRHDLAVDAGGLFVKFVNEYADCLTRT